MAGFSLDLPREWEQAQDPLPTTAFLAVEPESGRFRANVVVNVDPLPAGLDLEAWQDGIDQQLPGVMTSYLLLDREEVEISGRAAITRLAHHATPNGSVTMEQWTMVKGDTGLTLTGSVGTLDYEQYVDLFAAIAGSFQL